MAFFLQYIAYAVVYDVQLVPAGRRRSLVQWQAKSSTPYRTCREHINDGSVYGNSYFYMR